MSHADSDALGNYLAGLPRMEHPRHHTTETIREEEYKGHHIVIKTMYEITVDGVPLNVHIGISNDGKAHTHGLPNFEFASVVDMVRVLINSFPGEFSLGKLGGVQHGQEQPSDNHSTGG